MDTFSKDLQSIAEIEIELLRLVRNLETFGRTSDLYTRVDRAGYLALRTIDALGEMNINALATALRLDASTVTRQVAAMEKAGYVARRVDRGDRRTSTIVTTAKGRSVMHRVEARRQRLFARLTEDWSSTERTCFADLSAKLNAALAGDVSAQHVG